MNKKKLSMSFILFTSILSLTSCGITFPAANSLGSLPNNNSVGTSTSENNNSSSTSSTSTNDSVSNDSTTISSSEVSSSSSSSSSSSEADLNLGYTYNNLRYKISDFNYHVTPSSGSINVLVVPINLSTCSDARKYNLDTFSSTVLNKIDQYYSGEHGPEYTARGSSNVYYPSFKSYYEDISNGTLNVNVARTEVINAPSKYSISQLNDSSDNVNTTLFNLFKDVTDIIQTNYTLINYSDFDLNHDGTFDAVHFITNYNGAQWSDGLWPHMEYTNLPTESGKIVPNVYSLSAIEHFTDPLTAIHEQGHMFGLEDYYSYSQDSTYSYLGSADMQDNNLFDWNAFSKMFVGWAKPYVITGTKDVVTITLKASTINGECLVVPANYSTFNNSPFDEYFLFELYSKSAVNENDGKTKTNEFFAEYYSRVNRVTLGDYGIKAYYVNGQLCASLGDSIKTIDEPIFSHFDKIECACCNSNSSEDYGYGYSAYDDCPLISVISKSEPKKFATKRSSYSSSSLLKETDLYKEGDTFSFNDAKYTISKSHYNSGVTKMHNGETFPYSISFSEMNSNSCKVTISKV